MDTLYIAVTLVVNDIGMHAGVQVTWDFNELELSASEYHVDVVVDGNKRVVAFRDVLVSQEIAEWASDQYLKELESAETLQ